MGVFLRDKMTPSDLETSLELLERAIQLDPDYARAYGELSTACFYLGVFGVRPSEEIFPRAKTNALRALELDETVACAGNLT